MIRLIKKFRGKTPLGETLYGDYMSPAIRRKQSGEIEESKYARIRVGKEWRLVTDNSVKQLICYDQYGESIYEGDEVVDKEGKTWTAKLVCLLEDDDGNCVIVSGDVHKNFTLKEKTTENATSESTTVFNRSIVNLIAGVWKTAEKPLKATS